MKNFNVKRIFASLLAFTLLLTGCTTSTDSDKNSATTVEIKDIYGTVEVPVNPEVVVSLDNRTFETLADWKIALAAAPKDVMPADMTYYINDESVQNIGNHREPNLEMIAAANPDLVIVGQRFSSYYEEIKALVPNAVVVNFAFDVSETAEDQSANFINGFVETTEALGKIFSKTTEASKLIADFEGSIKSAKEAYNDETVMSVIVSGGSIGYSAPGSGRVWGPMYNIFNWVSSLDVNNTTSDHEGDEISVEAIAQSNPKWLFVLDRDAATSSATESTPAKDVIEASPALQNVTAITEGNIVYAPADTYTNESIQTYIELFTDLAEAFSAK